MKLKILAAMLPAALFCFAAPVEAAASTLTLTPASGTYAVGETFDLQVILATGVDQTSAADVIINYDPALLQVQKITPGELLSLYLGKEINNPQGQAMISAVASGPSELFQGQGVFATFTFQAQAAGTSQVSFDFTAGSVNDCNVAYAGNDLLVSVTNSSYEIGGVGGGTIPTPTATPTIASGVGGGTIPTPTATPTPATVPVTGNLSFTWLASILGGITLLIGGLLLAI